jgi:L-seryl-tRNA(Ser) seleniumtransferase
MFSGDKLLGGPQAGILAGTQATITPIRRHPLMRALRVDKLTYAALEATLEAYAAGQGHTVPVPRMIALTIQSIGERADRLAAALSAAGYHAQVRDGCSTIGGGSAPGSTIPTRLVALGPSPASADALEAALRAADPPVIARIEDGHVMLDLRTVIPDDDDILASQVASALSGLREGGGRPPSRS